MESPRGTEKTEGVVDMKFIHHPQLHTWRGQKVLLTTGISVTNMPGRRKLSEGAVNNSTHLFTVF